MEDLSRDSEQKRAYFERLRDHDCIVSVKEGMNLDSAQYRLAHVPEGLEFEIEDLRDSAIRFLNANIVVDTFTTHEERVAWYNESGVLEGNYGKLYLANKLRINILSGLFGSVKTYGQYFAKWHELGRFYAPTKLPEMVKELSLQDYDKNTPEEKLELVTKAETLAKVAINEMVEFGWIEGDKLE